MASYRIPPRLKNSDYSKGVITQDEYLRIAAANDAAIASARKSYQRGEVPQLTAIQAATPDELLADIGKQESDARSNLLRLGFRDQEATRITADLINEPSVLRMFNINYPSIEADIKKRFNPKLITPSFFLQYLKEYNENINASRGLDVNSSAAIRRPINALVNSVSEIRRIIPDRRVMDNIVSTIQRSNIVSNDVLQNILAIRDIIPTEEQLRALQAEGNVDRFNNIQSILDALSNLPSRAEIDNLNRNIGETGFNIVRQNQLNLINLANAIPSQRTIIEIRALLGQLSRAPQAEIEPEPEFYDAVPPPTQSVSVAPPPPRQVINIEEPSEVPSAPRRLQRQITEVTEETATEPLYEDPIAKSERLRAERNLKTAQSALSSGRDPRTLTPEQQAIYAQLAGVVRVAPTKEQLSSIGTTTSVESLASSIALDTASLSQMKATLRLNPDLAERLVNNNTGEQVNYNDLSLKPPVSEKSRKVWWEDTNIRELFQEKFGRGFKPKSHNLKKIILGKGISIREQPTYREFGKYAIHMPQLQDQDILNVKYRSLGGIPKFKPIPISDVFRDFLLDILDGRKPSERVYLQIEPKERKIFEEISIGAGVWTGLGLKRTTTSDEEAENKRFEVLRGIFLAGNNSPQVIAELRKLVIKFVNTGRIKRQAGLNLLMELS